MSQSPAPNDPSKGLPPWVLFAFLVIGPPAGIIALARTITQNPVVIALLVVLYEVLVFAFNFVGKIWGGLEKPLVDYIVEWIKLRAQEITVGYEQQYCQHLVYEHQVFDVKGLSTQTAHALELEHVFVELSIDPKAPHQATADPLQVPEHLRQGQHAIWDYLSSSSSLANPHLVILGAPGSGKTTLLKHIALILAQRKPQHHRVQMTHPFPILLFLRDYASTIKDQPDFKLVDAVQQHIQKKWQQTVPAQWIDHHLKQGRCLVLLDGLDEVADATTRQQIVAWVERQMLAHGNNRFVLTSRPYGYRDNPLDNVTVLEVHPFTSQQIERFVQNWYLAIELKSWGKEDPGVHLRAREGAEDLLRRLHRAPALLSLAVNPLLLTMITTVHRYRSSLPGKRVALYAEICEVFLGKRQEALGIAQELSAAQKQKVLRPLAYHLMQQNRREIAREEAQQVIASHLRLVNAQMSPEVFLRLIENSSGLLLERNPGICSFAHLTFQEYLAAVHIKEKGLEQVLVAQVGNSWWHETIRLYCAQADATAIILACLAEDRPSVSALTLALECDEEKLEIQPEAQTQLDTLLKTGIEDPEPERRRLVAEALLSRRLKQMVHLHGETYIDCSLVTCAEYQLFLDEQRMHGHSAAPDTWSEATFPQGHGRDALLGVRVQEAREFCRWLTERDQEGWSYRLPRREERQQIKLSVGAELPKDTSYWEEDGTLVWSHTGPSSFLIRQVLDTTHASDLASASVSDLADTLDRARLSASDLASNLASNLASDLARARALAFDLASDLAFDLAFDLASNLADTLDRAHLSASDLASDLAFARAYRLASDLAHAGALASTLARAGALTRARVRALARNLVDLTSTLTSTLTGALEIYIIIFLFLQRPEEGLPTYEGILLIKEHPAEIPRSS